MLKFNFDIDAPNFANEVRAFLGYIKMSQAELARQLKVSPSYVSFALNGKKNSKEFRKKIARYLISNFHNP